jgi:tRNA U34 2-thiouridine synthase MnmA/TrmU
LGAVDLKEFLKHYIKEKKGEVILVPSENEGENKHNVIGYHNGVVFHTLGERHGFTITKKSSNDSRYYIVAKDIKKTKISKKVRYFSAVCASRVKPLFKMVFLALNVVDKI